MRVCGAPGPQLGHDGAKVFLSTVHVHVTSPAVLGPLSLPLPALIAVYRLDRLQSCVCVCTRVRASAREIVSLCGAVQGTGHCSSLKQKSF